MQPAISAVTCVTWVQGKPVPEIYWAKAKGRAECCSRSAAQSWMYYIGTKFAQEQKYTETLLRLSLFLSLPCFAREAQGKSRSTMSSPVTDHGLPKEKTDEQKLLAVQAQNIIRFCSKKDLSSCFRGDAPLCSRQRQHFWGHWNSQAMAIELPSLDRSQS